MSDNGRDRTAEDEASIPLDSQQARAMGSQRPRPLHGVEESEETIFGEVDGPETEDQFDAHHAEPDEHV